MKDVKEHILYDLSYWLCQTPDERISAVEKLRKQFYDGNTTRLQRSARVIQRT